MSGFQSPNNKKKWVDSESESDGEHHHHGGDELISEADGVRAGRADMPLAGREVQRDDSSSDDSSSEEEDDGSNTLRLMASQPAAKPQPKVKQLSKKEKEELRKQELNDLDSLLAELGVEAESAPIAEAATTAEVEETTPADKGDDAAKKKKKKKSAGPRKAESTAAAPAQTQEPAATVDVSAILKARTKKNTAKKPDASDAQKIAMAEVKAKDSGSKKTKKDKSKFCEYSY